LHIHFFAYSALLLAGCTVSGGNQPACVVPTALQPDFTVAAVHVTPQASAAVPAGSVGYAMIATTVNGAAGWTLLWVGATGTSSCYSGQVSVAGQIDGASIAPYMNSSPSLVPVDSAISFASVTGTRVAGFSFTASSSIIYVTTLVDGSPTNATLAYAPVGSATEASTPSPAAFTSP
jgi:hypothetical protein